MEIPCLYGGNGFEELRNCQTHWLVHFKWVQFILRLNYPSVRKSMRKRGSLGLLGVHTRTLLLTYPRACSVSCPRLSSTPCPPPRSSHLPEEQLCPQEVIATLNRPVSVPQDANLSIYTNTPDLTPCFQNSLLAWIPCIYLWAALPCYLFYLRHHERGYIVLTLLSRLKTVRDSQLPSEWGDLKDSASDEPLAPH